MQLTYFTDYCFRVLIYLAQHPEARTTIDQLQGYFDISRNHLVKVVHWLGKNDYVTTSRGKGGGIALRQDPRQINVGEVLRRAEQRLDLVECMGDACQCRIVEQCGLQGVLRAGLTAFLEVADRYTLADVAGTGSRPLPRGPEPVADARLHQRK